MPNKRFSGDHRTYDLAKNIYNLEIDGSDLSTTWKEYKVGGRFIQFKFFNQVIPSGLEIVFDNTNNTVIEIYDGMRINKFFQSIYFRYKNDYDYKDTKITCHIGEFENQVILPLSIDAAITRNTYVLGAGTGTGWINIYGTGSKVSILLSSADANNLTISFKKYSLYSSVAPLTWTKGNINLSTYLKYARYEFNLNHNELLQIQIDTTPACTLYLEVEHLPLSNNRNNLNFDFFLTGQTILASGTATIAIDIPTFEKFYAVDFHLAFTSASTFSKDITFQLRNLIETTQNEVYAFWDDSAEVTFEYFQKRIIFAHEELQVKIVNNDGANDIYLTGLYVRFYAHD